MLGSSAAPENLGGATVTQGKEEEEQQEGTVGGSVSDGGFREEDRERGEEGDRNSGGSRWPREETLALLKIRSDMDVAFRDSSLKAPLWEEVARKLAEHGFHRSAKKCKEKFENIYKYHRRTKEGRSGRQNGKTYRFFEQLEALDHHPLLPLPPPPPTKPSTPQTTTTTTNPPNASQDTAPCSTRNPTAEFVSTTSTSTTSSSGKESGAARKRKRKLSSFFERLMREVLEKQEILQKKFVEAMEKCENDRIAREEAWKMQELARIKREQENLAQERMIAAAKDAAVIAYLQKISGKAVQLPQNNAPVDPIVDKPESSSGEKNTPTSSSRWPKAEVEALIRLRTDLDLQYDESGPKGPLWEEISLAMKKLGFDRSAKRCKEKWENINKYFKRVRERNKKRPEDSKTCPYFHQLDALYREKTKKVDHLSAGNNNSGYDLKPEELLMQMIVRPEQPESATEEEGESENAEHNLEETGDDEDEDGDGEGYRIVANSSSSMAVMG